MLPTFIVIGAQKSGTTSLLFYLKQHPEIFMAPMLEVRYFNEERKWRFGQEWYENLFAEAGDARARGEKSVNYTMHPQFTRVPEKIAAVVPDAKLVYLVRHPVKRTLSHYRNFLIDGREHRSPREALLGDPSYVDPSRYAFQLEQYLPHFRREQLLIVTTEALEADPHGTLAKVALFVGVAPEWPEGSLDERHNVTDPKQMPRGLVRGLRRVPGWKLLDEALPMGLKNRLREVTHTRQAKVEIPPEVVAELEARLRDDVAALREQWLGPSFDGWGLVEAPAAARAG